LRDDTTRMLAAGLLPRCPHPDQPAFWYLPGGTLACAPCTEDLIENTGEGASLCHVCGEPATAVAAWVSGGVPCVAGLCKGCHATGLVPLAPN
jgi:cytochrome c5